MKLTGTTGQYPTADLDEALIITQDLRPVNHLTHPKTWSSSAEMSNETL